MVDLTKHLEPFELPVPGQRPHSGCGSCGRGLSSGGDVRCGNGLEKIYPTTAVRFGYMRYIGEFTHAPELRFTCGAKVVIQTRRGIEIGEQVSLTCGGCDKAVTRDQMREWVKRSGEDTYMFNAGRILREATAADLAENARIQCGTRVRRDFARATAAKHRLPIKIVDCECLFGGERFVFHFTAAERVDFRAMVKDLAHEYRTRIEMRQIGARDEARLLADYETCGREVCCKVFLKTLKPISMRMAKLQKATLDPSQVSGRCGRLKCCLRYEHTGYEELDKKLPRVGARVRTEHGNGVVVNRQVLTQLVQIRTDEGTIVTTVVEDVLGPGTSVETPRAVPARRKAAPHRSPRRSTKRAGATPRAEKPASISPDTGEREKKASETDTQMAPKPPSGEGQPKDGASRSRRKRRRRRRRSSSSDGGSTP